ncbi:MAG: serine/threonine-protein kinase [Archangium sp.]
MLRRLGAGGMGEAWLARKGDAPPVVLKRVLRGLAERKESLDRFIHEARVIARLQSPCIARMIELGEVNGEWFIAMEYVEGSDLQSRIEHGPALTQEEVRRVALDGAEALLAAHEARDAAGRITPVIHRDVSPHNLLMGVDGRVRLIDFGVASLTGEGESGGKYGYSAPEQLLEDVADQRSDQYSLGVVLWECLMGKPCFMAEEDVEVIRLVTEVGVPALPDSVPEEWRALVSRMTSLDPAARFSSLRDVTNSPLPSGERVRVRGQSRRLVLLKDGMTVEEAEAVVGVSMLKSLIDSGHARIEDGQVFNKKS